jgi:hypothetical protein
VSSVNLIKNLSNRPPGYLEMPRGFGIFDSEFSNAESNISGSINITRAGNLVNSTLTNLSRAGRGGAIFIDRESAAIIMNSKFSSCAASSEGGCLFVESRSYLELESLNFRNASADTGSILFAKKSTIGIKNSLIYGGMANQVL